VEPEAAFENPEDYVHVFSADEGIAWKLMTAIYDAKVGPVSISAFRGSCALTHPVRVSRFSLICRVPHRSVRRGMAR
jgi:hypothetical protein